MTGALGVVGACAQGTIFNDVDSGTGTDASTGDGSACPQFDLKTDAEHCGSCTYACKTGEVCSNGA